MEEKVSKRMAKSEGFNIYRSALFAWIMARRASLNTSKRKRSERGE